MLSGGTDHDIVAAWLEPVGLRVMLAALREAGFSGDVYRACFADLNANLDDEDAGALHFLRHGYAESRVFPVALDLAGLSRLRQLGVRNRVYLQNLFVALATAWVGANVGDAADLATHGPTIERLRGMGALPLVILGDPFAALYRRGASAGARWICPLALAPLEGGIEALLRTAPRALLAARPDLDIEAIPTLWNFGQVDIEQGYLSHRLHRDVGPGDMDAFRDFAMPLIQAYGRFLAAAVPAHERALHWIAGAFPPAAQAADQPLPARLVLEFGAALQDRLAAAGADSLLDRTAMHQAFNDWLGAAAANLGFNVVRNFDCFLTGHGVVDPSFLAVLRDSRSLDYQATGAVIATSLWSIVEGRRLAASPGGMSEQFERLLQEIRLVQLGQPG